MTNPAVADATVVQPREILIDGKAPGTISLIVWGADQRDAVRRRRRAADHGLEQQLQQLFPGEDVTVTINADAIVLSGQVSSTQMMLRSARSRGPRRQGERHQHAAGAGRHRASR